MTFWLLRLLEGCVRPVPGNLPALASQYTKSAVGKLGVVFALRLVVDSSVTGVTAHTRLPNRSANPILNHLRVCLPSDTAQERLRARVLDVSKARRRILIRTSA